jgi:hypothetical protein
MQRHRRRGISATFRKLVARCSGASLLRHRYKRTASSYWILSGSSNQCKRQSSSVTCSHKLVGNIPWPQLRLNVLLKLIVHLSQLISYSQSINSTKFLLQGLTLGIFYPEKYFDDSMILRSPMHWTKSVIKQSITNVTSGWMCRPKKHKF